MSRKIEQEVKKLEILDTLIENNTNSSVIKKDIKTKANIFGIKFLQVFIDDELILENRNLYSKKLEERISKLDKISEDICTEIIDIDDGDIYFYYQSRINVGNKNIYVNILQKYDIEIVQLIKNELYFLLFIIFSNMIILIFAIFPLIYNQYKKVISSNNNLLLSYFNTITSLGTAISKRDGDTSEHNYRVTYYSYKIAKKINIEKERMGGLLIGSFLHDIGEIAIQDNILLKKDKLTKDEFEIMKTHVFHGMDIIKDIEWLNEANSIIKFHHEKIDGTGYPFGLKDKNIPLEARVFAIVDVFDALTSKRPYKEAINIYDSFEIIKNDIGTHFDKEIVKVFEEIYEDSFLYITQKNEKELKEIFYKQLKPYFFI
ncbi:HD-GYP domain-containing protein [Arcobacter sp. LA11]|uniref:HD-GYP domain-containing protein n=1 Tax=Arcobacter sp. LA11 TaxID=1898176 RepID=UPI0009332F50|nr:HD domain-containing phosphohydrolase [Arcobacter sp. LA11]